MVRRASGENASDLELAQLRRGRAVGRDSRHQNRHRIADREAEILSNDLADDHSVRARHEIRDAALVYGARDVGHVHFARGIDSPEQDRLHIWRMHGQRLNLCIRRHALDARLGAHELGRLAPLFRGGRVASRQRAGCNHASVCT